MTEPLENGEFGRYRVLRPLGQGGMGEVYLAYDDSLRRQVAIKVISEARVAGEDARRRILHEARASAAIDHPGVCTVYETGLTADDRPFIVMQYVEGEPLSDVLDRGAMPVRRALTLCLEIAGALDASHRQGVIHRDLKPSNILVTPDGHPKLVDFGIATVVATAAASDARTTSPLVDAGSSWGTPGYMSPEQIQGQAVDARSDLFSLGAVLFECLTGKRAFVAPTWIETTAKVLHVHPPPVSSLRPGLTEQHDQLCDRLLAKDAADRFQTAQEVEGALRLLTTDTAAGTGRERQLPPPPPVRWWQRPVVVAGLALALALLAAGAWLTTRPRPLPAAPSTAHSWYLRGTEQIRQGAYQSAVRALQQAIGLYPDYALAYARLAEAQAQLDDGRAASDSLLRVTSLVGNEARLPEDERYRLQAVRALVLRDVDGAVDLYRRLVGLHADDAGSWLDLGRAQEAAGRATDARASYEEAVKRDQQYAAAHLRLGVVDALDSLYDEARAAFAQAERLYGAASDREGQTEVLLRRGAMFDNAGELDAARQDLERALSIATDAGAAYQAVQARLKLSSVTASEGHFAEAEDMAQAAVKEAAAQGMRGLAADGLVDLSATLLERRRLREAEAKAREAVDLATRQQARRTIARARIQLAAICQEDGRHREALAILDEELPFLEANRYRRYELLALTVASRARLALDELADARDIAADVLRVAESVQDDSQVALAASGLASVRTALGDYPAALELRKRAEAIHQAQGYSSALPYDLSNRAEILVVLGRDDEARAALDQIAAGIGQGIDAYVGRRRRMEFLRAFADATADRCERAAGPLARIVSESASDSSGMLAPSLLVYCEARRRSRPVALPAAVEAEPNPARERAYWRAAAALEAGDSAKALSEARQGLQLLGEQPNDELRWRLAAVGSVAAAALGDRPAAADLQQRAQSSLTRLRSEWGGDVVTYERRADLTRLRERLAGTPVAPK